MSDGSLTSRKIVLAVTGSIALYKAVLLLRRLTEEGAEIRVVMTSSARQFMTPLTFEVLSRTPVLTDVWRTEGGHMAHLTLTSWADLILVAPATAHVLSKMAHGLADDLLSCLLLASERPVLVAPAMDEGMWRNPATQENLSLLRRRGVQVIEPERGPLASGRIGEGRLATEDAILTAVRAALSPKKDLQGEVVVVTAGPTREFLDPVRFLSNRSSGRMGYALAESARDRGARVILITGPTSLARPHGLDVVDVVTTEEMKKAVESFFKDSTVLLMAAAVNDFQPARRSPQKIKRVTGREKVRPRRRWTVEFVSTEDILKERGAAKGGRVVVGFAAETEDVKKNAFLKLREKNLDLIVANDVTLEGAGFDSETNIVQIFDRAGRGEKLPRMSKRAVSEHILDRVVAIRRRAKSP